MLSVGASKIKKSVDIAPYLSLFRMERANQSFKWASLARLAQSAPYPGLQLLKPIVIDG